MRQPGEKEGVVKYAFEHERGPATVSPDLADCWSGGRGSSRGGSSGRTATARLREHQYPALVLAAIPSQRHADQRFEKRVDVRHFAEVTVVDLDRNFLRCVGEAQASWEALTYAALYTADPEIRGVVHAHSQPIWERHRHRLPTTRDDVEYGTPQMAYEMIRLYRGVRGAPGCHRHGWASGRGDRLRAFAGRPRRPSSISTPSRPSGASEGRDDGAVDSC